MVSTEQGAFLDIFFFAGAVIFMISVGSWISSLLRPHRLTPAKASTYESGEEASGNAQGSFNISFYGMAVAFVLFEIETVLLFPWARVWMDHDCNEKTAGMWGSYAAGSALLFIALLALGLVYLWSRGHLEGWSSANRAPAFSSPIPRRCYEQVNKRYMRSSKTHS